MLKITKDFGLLGIALGPFPLLQELLVPGETVNVGVGIATRAGVAVPVPGAAYSFTAFIDSHLQSQFVPQRLQHVQAGKTRANHDSVKVLSCATHFCLSSVVVCTDDRETRSSARAGNPAATPPFAPRRARPRRRLREPQRPQTFAVRGRQYLHQNDRF